MKRPEWKQRGPKDQATVILMALSHLVELVEDYPHLLHPETLVDNINRRTQEIKDLCQEYLPEEW